MITRPQHSPKMWIFAIEASMLYIRPFAIFNFLVIQEQLIIANMFCVESP